MAAAGQVRRSRSPPGAFVFALWTFANWLIMGNPLFWYQGLNIEAAPPGNAAWLPAHRTLVNGIMYAAGYSWAFVPGLIVVLPLLVLVVMSRRRRFWEVATIVSAAAVFPGQVAVLLAEGKSWGDPRYFASLTIFATVTLGLAAREVAAARRLPLPVGRAFSLVLVCLAAADAVSGTYNDINPKTTPVESESVAFRAALGLSKPNNAVTAVVAWHRFDVYMDRYLSKGQLIMIDTGTAFPAVLFSRYPAQWVIPSDRDFQKLADNFSGQFQWLLSTPTRVTYSATIEIAQALSSTVGGHWQAEKDFGPTIGELYRWVPKRS